MNIFFVGQIIPTQILNNNFENLNNYCDAAANVFYNNLLNGLSATGNDVSTISTVKNRSNIDYTDKKIKYTYTLNYANKNGIFDHIKLLFKTYAELKKWSKNSSEEKAIIFNCLRFTQCISGIIFCKLHDIKSIAVVTDVPGHRSTPRNEMTFKNKFIDSMTGYMLSKYDGYVFLSDYMKNVIPKSYGKYIVIEGICSDDNNYQNPVQKDKKFTVMYAGSLMKKYNIMNLVDAVINLNDKNVELKLYGKGELESELADISKKYTCIKYYGSVSNKECLIEQMKSHLLVNPRSSDEEYTKYSFPSKNIEYMKSGTPVLYTKLPSMPKEYYEYVNIIDDESASGIEKAIRKILESDYNLLLEKANRAKSFVEREKNSCMQAHKVLTLIKNY